MTMVYFPTQMDRYDQSWRFMIMPSIVASEDEELVHYIMSIY